MAKMRKYLSILLSVILAASFLLIATPTTAQSISKPSAPEFVVQYVNHAYDLPPKSTIDPYTGETIVTSQGGNFDNFSIEVKIRNQAFTSTIDSSGNHTSLYYNLRFKGHYENETKWIYYPVVPTDYGSASHPVDPFQTGARGSQYLDASHSQYSIFTLPKWQTSNIPEGGQLDVQVQALIGHDNKYDLGVVFMGGELIKYYFEGEYTDWSDTQIVTIDKNSAITPTDISTPSPSVPEFSIFWILSLLVVIPLTIFVTKKKRNCLKTYN
jgi:hypothetical protein